MPVLPLRQQVMVILWPAFLMAGVLEMLVFAVVDPGTLQWFGQSPVQLSAPALYTLAFGVFWLVIALAGALMALLARTPEDVNVPVRRSAPRWPG